MDQDDVSSEIENEVVQEAATDIVEQMQEDNAVEQPVEKEEQRVPLATLQKMRKRAQEAELKAQWLEQQYQKVSHQPAQSQEDDSSKYESATKEDLGKSQNEAVRIIEERLWIKSNPEKFERVNEYLPQFLKQRPNLASAIDSATNRYEEAFTLMEALTPKQQQQLKPAQPKKEAPGSPTSVPKAASLNQAVDVMSMNDQEFSQWRQAQKRRR